LARLLAPCFDKAWVGTINFYEKGDRLRQIYEEHGWQKYLSPDHARAVEEALLQVGLRQPHPP
jgi:hypothetical protein